jgi:acetylornithine deacetylase/succinyl-diaminopimelate desuccinylase-like protein
MTLDPVELLRQLIRIPSINPMGRDVSGPPFGEQQLTDFLQDQCAQLGLPWLRQRVHPGRDNLLALVRGRPEPTEGGELLLWEVHQDTVPIEGMTIEPFSGDVRDGRVYGRGACDVKGGMATMLAAISRVVSGEQSATKSPTIVVAFTVNEECGYTGARALRELWSRRDLTAEIVGGTTTPKEMFPVTPEADIVGCRADKIPSCRRPPRDRALAVPNDRPCRSHVAARFRRQCSLWYCANRSGDSAVSW